MDDLQDNKPSSEQNGAKQVGAGSERTGFKMDFKDLRVLAAAAGIVVVLLLFLFLGGGDEVSDMEQEAKVIQTQAVKQVPTAREELSIEIKGSSVATMSLAVSGLRADGRIPLKYTCYRKHVSPELTWGDVPAGTKSFVVTMSKMKGDKKFVHWVVFNIPGDKTSLPEAVPSRKEFNGGMHALSDYNSPGYIGPCEAEGRIEYTFRIQALDVGLNVSPGAPHADVSSAAEGHVIGEGIVKAVHFYQ